MSPLSSFTNCFSLSSCTSKVQCRSGWKCATHKFSVVVTCLPFDVGILSIFLLSILFVLFCFFIWKSRASWFDITLESSTKMLTKTAVLLVACLAITVSSLPTPQAEEGKHWVVIVAGSNGWYNYRHQVRAGNNMGEGGVPVKITARLLSSFSCTLIF